MVQALLESGADPNVQNLQGDNAAHIAARVGSLKVQKSRATYECMVDESATGVLSIFQNNWSSANASLGRALHVDLAGAIFIVCGENANMYGTNWCLAFARFNVGGRGN